MDPYNYPSLHEKNRTALFVFFVLNLVAEILLKYMLFNTLSKIKQTIQKEEEEKRKEQSRDLYDNIAVGYPSMPSSS